MIHSTVLVFEEFFLTTRLKALKGLLLIQQCGCPEENRIPVRSFTTHVLKITSNKIHYNEKHVRLRTGAP